MSKTANTNIYNLENYIQTQKLKPGLKLGLNNIELNPWAKK